MENLEGEVEAEESALIGAAGGICFVKLFDLKIKYVLILLTVHNSLKSNLVKILVPYKPYSTPQPPY